jgi:hypothetical protein
MLHSVVQMTQGRATAKKIRQESLCGIACVGAGLFTGLALGSALLMGIFHIGAGIFFGRTVWRTWRIKI